MSGLTSTAYLIDGAGGIWRYDDLVIEQLADFDLTFTDIATSPSGQVYLVTADALYEFEPLGGTLDFVASIDIGSANALDISSDGTAYLGSDNSNGIYALNLSTGTTDLLFSSQSASAGDIVVRDNLLYFSTSDRNVYVHDISNGSLVDTWEHGISDLFGLMPASEDDDLLIGFSGNDIYLLRSDDSTTPLGPRLIQDNQVVVFGADASSPLFPQRSNFQDAAVGSTTRFPTMATARDEFGNVDPTTFVIVVTDQLEITPPRVSQGDGVLSASFDVSATRITMTALEAGTYANVAFNGPVLEDVFDVLPAIIDVRLVSSDIGHTASDITFTEDAIFLNNAGLTQSLGDQAIVEVTFAKGELAQLFAANADAANGLSAAYQTLLGGVPNEAGFVALINAAVSTNFGAGPGPVFNTENIFINLVNNLVQGNPAAKTQFDQIATGTTLEEKITSIYQALVPPSKQTAEGLIFLTSAQNISFYQGVAAERGVAGTDGAAIIAMASLLNIITGENVGVGNAVRDLSQAVAAGNAALPATGSTFTDIEIADGTAFDGDDAAAIARQAIPEVTFSYLADESATVEHTDAALVGVDATGAELI